MPQDLCNALLQPDPSRRLGSDGDVTRLLSHKFFESLDVAALAAGTLPSPLLKGSVRQIEKLIERAEDPAESINDEPCPEVLQLADGDGDRFADLFLQ